MSITNARRFVARLREDRAFRNKALDTSGPEELTALLQTEGLIFDERELVEAMAECMAQLEVQKSE